MTKRERKKKKKYGTKLQFIQVSCAILVQVSKYYATVFKMMYMYKIFPIQTVRQVVLYNTSRQKNYAQVQAICASKVWLIGDGNDHGYKIIG
jgi:hypothetical protein